MVKNRFLLRKSNRCGIEAVEAETDHVFPKHTHEQFGIGLIWRGAQTSLSGRGMVDAGQGDVITVNPGEVHDGMPIGDHGRAWKMLYFDPALILASAGDLVQTRTGHELRHPVLHDRLAAQTFQQLYHAVTDDISGPSIDSESLLLTLLDRLLSERIGDPVAAYPIALRRAQALIDNEPLADITLANLAHVSGLSRFQVLRGFARMTGMTPHAYLMQKRVDLARQLIRQKLSLADVAAASGFADQSHMTRAFTSRYGITPGALAALG